ncbi:MAG: O-antigen ligase family protein [Thermomicrobiales bacterium]
MRRISTTFGSYLAVWIGWGATAGAEVLLLPFLSRLLSANEYGTYLLVYGIVLFLADAAAVWASSAYVRIAASSDEKTKRKSKETLLVAVVLTGLAALFIELFVAAASKAVGADGLARAFVASAFLLPGLSIFTFALADYQASGRRIKFGALSVGRFLAMTSLGVMSVLLIDRSGSAYLGGAAIGVTLLTLPYLATNLPKGRPGPGSLTVVRDAFHFGLGMWFQYLAGKILRIGDRFVVGAFIGAAAVGIYGAEYALLFGAVAMVVSPLITVITPRAYSTADKKGDAALAEFVSKILVAYVPIMFVAVSGLFIVAPVVFAALVPSSYSGSLRPDIVLALEVAAGLHGVTLIVNLILAVKRRTLVSAKLFALLAVANIACNFVLVPVFGIPGAVYANILSYSVLLVFTLVWTRRYVEINLPAKAGLIALFGFALLGVISAESESMVWWVAGSLEVLTTIVVVLAIFAVSPIRLSAIFARLTQVPETHRVLASAEKQSAMAIRWPEALFRVPEARAKVTVPACLLAVACAAIVGSSSRNADLLVSALIWVGCAALAFLSAPVAVAVMVTSGRTGIGPLNGTVFDVTFFAAVGLGFAGLVNADRRKLLADLIHPIAILQIAFTFLVALSYLNTRGYGYAGEKTFRVVLYGLVFLILPLWYLSKPATLARFFLAFIAIADAMAVVSVLWTLKTSSLSSMQRINAPSGGPITLARILATGTIACVAVAIANRRFRSLLLVNGFGLLGLTFATGSRGPALFLLLVMFAMPFASVLSQRLRAISPKLIVALLVVLVAAVPVWHRLQSSDIPFVQRFGLLTQADRGVSVDLREDNYQLAIELSRQTSWQANGTGFWAVALGDGETQAYPHNIFLEILVEQGAFGLAVFVLFVIAVLFTGVRRLTTGEESFQDAAMTLGAFCCFLFALLAAQTSGDLYDNRTIFFFGAVILALRSPQIVAQASETALRSRAKTRLLPDRRTSLTSARPL